MADAHAPDTQGEVPNAIIITTLSGLDGVKNEVYIKTVLNNLDMIYTCNKNEIIAKFEDNESDPTLKELRLQQLAKIGQMFP